MILAVSLDGKIGHSHTTNQLPWDNPEDLNFFKDTTKTHTVLMGRKTFESLPFSDGLPRRKNLILSSNGKYLGKRCQQLSSVPEFLDYADKHHNEVIFIIGGGVIYDQLHQYCDRVYLTRIDQEFPEADVKISLDFLRDFDIIEHIPLNDYSEVEVWQRKK